MLHSSTDALFIRSMLHSRARFFLPPPLLYYLLGASKRLKFRFFLENLAYYLCVIQGSLTSADLEGRLVLTAQNDLQNFLEIGKRKVT